MIQRNGQAIVLIGAMAGILSGVLLLFQQTILSGAALGVGELAVLASVWLIRRNEHRLYSAEIQALLHRALWACGMLVLTGIALFVLPVLPAVAQLPMSVLDIGVIAGLGVFASTRAYPQRGQIMVALNGNLVRVETPPGTPMERGEMVNY